MVSDIDSKFEELFSCIKSSQTAKRFKLLRFATTEDLARTFQHEKTEFAEQEELVGFETDVKSRGH